jgi:hypothetical protein
MTRAAVRPPEQPHGKFVKPPQALIASLPAIRKETLTSARNHWSGYTTADAINLMAEYIEGLKGILMALAVFYPANHFGDRPAAQYFDEQLSARAWWHRAHMEPDGPGSGGTMIGPMVAARMAADLSQMVVDIVTSLDIDPGRQSEFENWKASWDAAGT